MKRGRKIAALVLALAAGAMTAGLVACDGEEEPPRQEQTAAAEKIKDGGAVVFTDGRASIDLAQYVKANGNPIRVASSNENVAVAAVSGSTMSVTAVGGGSAIVTVVCGEVRLTFSVFVPEAFYTVTLDGVPVAPAEGEKWTAGSVYTLPDEKESEDLDFEFKGWNVNGEIKQAGENVSVDRNLTITAVFERKAAEEVNGHAQSVSLSAGKSATLNVSDYIAAYGREVTAEADGNEYVTVGLQDGVVTLTGVAEGSAELTLSCEGVTVKIAVNVLSADMPTFANATLDVDLFTQESSSLVFTPQEPSSEHTYRYVYALKTQNQRASVTGDTLTFTPGTDYDIAEDGATVPLVVEADVTVDGIAAGKVTFTVTVHIKDTAPQAPAFGDVNETIDPFSSEDTENSYTLLLKAEDEDFTYTYKIGEKELSGSKKYTAEADETVSVTYVYKGNTNKSGTASFTVKVTYDRSHFPALKEESKTENIDLAFAKEGVYVLDLFANFSDSGNIEGYTVNGAAHAAGTSYSISNADGEYGETAKAVTFTVVATVKNNLADPLSYTYTVNVTDTSAFRVENEGFETGDLTGWAYQGIANPDKAVNSNTHYWDPPQPYNQVGNYHFDGWTAQGSEDDAYHLKSSTFTLGGSGFISFKMGGNAALVKVFKADGTQIAAYRNTKFNDLPSDLFFVNERRATMMTYVADLHEYLDQELYIELHDVGNNGWGVAFFDDIVTYYGTAPVVAGKTDAVTYDGKKYDLPWENADNDLDQVFIVNPVENKVVTEQTGYDFTALLEGVTAKYGAAQTPVTDIKIIKIVYGAATLDNGFNSVDLTEGTDYKVTYAAEYNGKITEKTFTVLVHSDVNRIANGGFETGDLTGWTYQGIANPDKAVNSNTHYWDPPQPYNQVGNYHFDGWTAQGSEDDAYHLKSSTFTLGGSGFISFKMGGNAALVKVFKADGTQIAAYRNTKFNDLPSDLFFVGERRATMMTYVADLHEYLDQELYIELHDVGNNGWGVAFFDDIVTYYETAPVVAGKTDAVTYDGKKYDLPWENAVNEYTVSSEG